MANNPTPKRPNPHQPRRPATHGPTHRERDYLAIIYYLTQRAEPVIAAHIARWLNLQPPTVSHALKEMEKKAFILRNERSEIALTPAGTELAMTIIRRRRLVERFLADVVQIPWHLIYEEAIQLEHALSPMIEERLTELARTATTCPHGNPIPLSGAGYAGAARLDHAPIRSLFTIRRIEEEAEEQVDLLRYLEANQLLPDRQFLITDTSAAYGVTLRSCNHDITLSPEIARVIWGDVAAIAA